MKESKKGKQDKNTNVPEPEDNRLGRVKREAVPPVWCDRQEQETQKECLTGEAWAWRGRLPISMDTEGDAPALA